MRPRWAPAMSATAASVVVVASVFLVLAIHRRWISDDGLIYTRVVRNILEGNGPVFNAFERAEANTSALWPWLVAAVCQATSWDPAPAAVWLGIACSVAGLAIAMDGTRRWHRARGSDAALVPGSALIVLGVFPFWDYASSGLESGLCMLWIGVSWWILVTLGPAAPRRHQHACALVLGLGPMCRPDLAVASLMFLLAGWWILRPRWARAAALAATALALPLAYEVFRAGFYGALVPLPALAKSAAHAEWGRGLAYVRNFVQPHWLWIPAAVFAVVLAIAVRKRAIGPRDRILIAAPVVSGAVLGLYIMRVGGDFMHGRLCLPLAFLIALPGLLVPLRRFTGPAAAVLAVWAVLVGAGLIRARNDVLSTFVNDERRGYVLWTRTRHPTQASAYVAALNVVGQLVEDSLRDRKRLMITEGGAVAPLDPRRPEPLVFVAGRLGAGGAVTPIDGITADTLGLANPIGARITQTYPEEGPGHQKVLPAAWLYADFTDPDHDDPAQRAAIGAARRAMTCGELGELLASVRAPLTLGRFWANLVGSIGRTRLVIPAEPADAERRFCGP